MKQLSSKRYVMQTSVIVSFVAFFFCTMLPVQAVHAETVEEGAKREGKVVFYCGMVFPDVRALADGFQKKYPFVKLEHYRAGENKILEKLLTEKRGGKTFADVEHMAGLWTNVYKKEGLLTKYVSPEAKIFPQGFSDPEGFWTAYYNTYLTFIYNTRLVTGKDIPKSLDDLLLPKWKGKKIGLYDDEFEWYVGMMDLLGKEKGPQFMKRLGDQDLVLRGGRTLISTLLVAGEFPLALGAVHRTLAEQKIGAPIALVNFPTPTLASMRCIGIHPNAPHPNASKLLVDFILSKEGQTILNRINRHPIRADIPVEPAVEAVRRNLFPIGPQSLERLQGLKKEYEKVLLKR